MSRASLIRRTSDRPRALLALIAVMFGLWTVWSTMVLPYLPEVRGTWHTVQSVFVRVTLWVMPCAWYLWTYKRDRVLEDMGLGLPSNVERGLGAMSLVAVAALAVSVDVSRKLDVTVAEVWQELWNRGVYEGFQTPFFEELVFRGVIFAELLRLSGLSQRAELLPFTTRIKRAWLANLGASLVFVGMHWPWWIFTEGLGLGLLVKSLPVFLLSLVLGVVFARGRSVWPCILLHWLNNSLAQLAGS